MTSLKKFFTPYGDFLFEESAPEFGPPFGFGGSSSQHITEYERHFHCRSCAASPRDVVLALFYIHYNIQTINHDGNGATTNGAGNAGRGRDHGGEFCAPNAVVSSLSAGNYGF